MAGIFLERREALNRKSAFKSAGQDLACGVGGSLIYAAGVRIFLDPNQISIGGFTGVGSLLNHLWSLPIGLSVLALNLPLLFFARKKLGKKFFLKTVFATGILSLALDAVPFLPAFTEDKLLAAIAGGSATGIGLSLIYGRGMATGGTDLLAKMIQHWFRGASYGRVILITDGAILILSAIVYKDAVSILYSAVTVWLSTTVIDAFLNGLERAKSVSIITEKKQAVLNGILNDLRRGATVWEGEGGYTREGRDVILVVVRNYELFPLKRAVKEADPNAFMIVSDATEVLGKGFPKRD